MITLRRLYPCLLTCLIVGLSDSTHHPLPADEAVNIPLVETTARDVIDKAIQAHGGPDELNKQRIQQVHVKATSMFGQLPYTATITMQLPRQFKNEMHMEVQGKKVTTVQVMNGDIAWVSQTGESQPPKLTSEVIADMMETRHEAYVGILIPLLDSETYKLSLLGETQINGKAALGVKVESKGHKDIQLYFDKTSGLLVKIARRILNTSTMTEHLSEAYRSFKDVDGGKRPVFEVHMDGQKLAEGEVLEVRYFDKLEDSVFERADAKEAAKSLWSRWWTVAAGLAGLLVVGGAVFWMRARRLTQR